ncbi:MAG: bifunctional glycosyltransferase family 2/GtrA family protein [Oscillospiraceae bacterium]|nr:bifunctional glycosyltransferase family 2/GtrA family protein [Oscillospiraceae bacterium]
MSDYTKILVVIPSLDPDEKLMKVIRGVQEIGFTDILLVDDGSAEKNQHYFEEGAAAGCEVLHHGVNKGKGRALKTAFDWFMKNRPDSAGVVTIDGDNQHLPHDIAACVDVMNKQEKDALVLGVRDFNQPQVPPKSRFGNKLTSSVFRIFCGLHVSDTQTGLRVFPRSIIPAMLEIAGERFEYETNMLLVCKQKDIPIVEQTIDTVYINDNETTHFHPIKDSLRVYGIIIKFFLSSLLSFLLDYGIFNLLYAVFKTGFWSLHRLFFATTIARVLSSLFNFTVNRKAVFRSDAPLATTMARYYILWAFQLLASFGLVKLLSGLFGDSSAIVAVLKLLVDMFLYFVSFRVQQVWVFKPAKEAPAKS